jgi:hypothetical protein
MALLNRSRAVQTLRTSVSETDQLRRSYAGGTHRVAPGAITILPRPARSGSGHLDFLVTDYDTSNTLGSTAAKLARASQPYASDKRRTLDTN